MKKFLKKTFTIISTIIVVSTVSIIAWVIVLLSTLDNPHIDQLQNTTFTTILSEDQAVIEVLGKDKEEYVTYQEIPYMLVNSLISIEDANFFTHKGVDYRRTLQAFVHNVTSGSTHGGSTITQQLVKNILLSEEQTYERKIKEAYLAYQLEANLTKEEILQHYFNSVYFEQSIPGVVYASRKYFNKELVQLSIPECAILAGVVKSASYYNPLKYPDRIEIRKNLVINRLYELGYIGYEEKNASLSVHASELVVNPDDVSYTKTYRFQAYLDIVYLEAYELTGLDPFVDKLEISTYLDTSLQTYLDGIQEGKEINFTDDDQQIAATVIRNEDSAIRGVIGGRNYKGSRIFNRAYSMRRQPASTMKPIFSYLLAAEHLNYNSATTVMDEPYTYPGSSFTVQNADKNYLGKISVLEALGYSKNTAALHTLGNVGNKIGNKGLTDHLTALGIMDDGPFTYSYGIGGMSYGVSPTQLAGAYSTLPNAGNYVKPSTISMIKNSKSGEIVYTRDMDKKKIVSEESAFIIADTLTKMIEKNYFGIGVVGVNGVQIGAKTGTNGFDLATTQRLGYPSSADKDTWIAGFSPEYSLAVWSGFDLPTAGKKHYFGSNDQRRKIPKIVFQSIMNKISIKSKTITKPSSLTKVNVVMGADGMYLANSLIPSSYILGAYFKENQIPNEVLPMPKFEEITDLRILITDTDINLEIISDDQEEDKFDYQRLYGKKGYLLTIINWLGEKSEIFSETKKINLSIDFATISSISVEHTFTNKYDIRGNSYSLSF